jgi:hypothetical protein
MTAFDTKTRLPKKPKVKVRPGATKPSRSRNLGSKAPESQRHIGGPK